MKVVLVDSDDAGTFRLDGRRSPVTPIPPGNSIEFRQHLKGPAVIFIYLRLGPCPDVSTVGPDGVFPIGPKGSEWDASAWRLDEVTIDEVPVDHLQVGGAIGTRLFMGVTNVGEVPAHFYAYWECEDVH